jgi:hypothetical protein
MVEDSALYPDSVDKERQQLLNDIKIHMGFDKIDDQTWVLESPDGGKTVTRRKPGQIDKFLLENISGRWHSMDELRALARKQDRETAIREQYPAAKEAWDIYQSLVQVIDPNIDKPDTK